MAKIYITLSAPQLSLLTQHWAFYRALDDGRRDPTTEAQRRFVSVCHGEREPETEHEVAYLLGRRVVQNSTLSTDEIVRRGFSVSPRDMKDSLALSHELLTCERAASTRRPTQYHAVDKDRFSSNRYWVPMHNW